jgi:hypothetical protein
VLIIVTLLSSAKRIDSSSDQEQEAFLHLEGTMKITNFITAKPTDIAACIALNRELFAITNTASNEVLIEKWTGWVEKNPEIIQILKSDDQVVGILTILPFKPQSQRFSEALHSDHSFLLGDVQLNANDIEEYANGKHVALYVAEMGVKPSLSKDLRRRYGAKLIAKFRETIIGMGKRGIIIDEMLSVGASKSGIRLLHYFGFCEVLFPRDDTRLFTINMKESGAPIIKAYREALQDAQATIETGS